MDTLSSEVFSAIFTVNLPKLWDYPREWLSPFLPLICKAVFHSLDDSMKDWERFQKGLHSLLLDIESVNYIKGYLELNFEELKQDAVKEKQLMKKLSPGEQASSDEGLIMQFENGNEGKRFRLILSEMLQLLEKVDTPFQLSQVDLFECELFIKEVAHIIAIAARELPMLLPAERLAEAFLRVNNGSYFISCLLANIPEMFDRVIKSLILNGESLDEISLAGRLRSQAIQDLVAMHPSQASYVQWLAYTNQKLPTLMIFIALDNHLNPSDESEDCHKGGSVLSLMSDIVIHGSDEMRLWFAQYMKLMQQKYRRHKESAITALRKFLMKQLMRFINYSHEMAYSTEEQDNEMEVELEVGVAGGDVREDEEEEKMDTLTMELVDQMEIEISETDQDYAMESKPKAETKVSLTKEDQPRHRRRHSSSFALDTVVFSNISVSNQFSDKMIDELAQLIHVLCGLKVQVHMYLTGDETSAILRLITSTCPPFSSAGVAFVKVALSVLLACPFLISTDEGEQATVKWLQWLLDYQSEFEKVCPGESCYGEMLLLVAMHLQDKQLDQISKLIQSVLGMKITNTIKSGHFSTLKSLFLKVFNESVVCSHAVNVTPTPKLNGKMTGFLPVHCVHQLIQSKAFRKYGVSVKEWIYKQICCVEEPLHVVLPSLVEEYVQAILVPQSHTSSRTKTANASTQIPFTAEEVLSVFDDNSQTSNYSSASQILMLYYVLHYHDCYLATLVKRQPGGAQVPGSSMKKYEGPRAYSPNVVLQLPVKRLLQYASLNQESFLTLYPSLLRLIVTHFPHLCLAEDWIKEQELFQNSAATNVLFKPLIRIPVKKITVEYTKEVLLKLETKPHLSLLVLSHLSSLCPLSLLPYCTTIASCIDLLLGENVNRHVQQLYCSLWTKLNSVVPRRLWVETVNALRPIDQKSHPQYTYKNLVEDPLIVLRCNRKVFRSPNVFEILLRVLASFTAASRVWLSEHAHVQNSLPLSDERSDHELTTEEREELRIALTAAQESAIIQLLLEVCLPLEQDRKEASVLGPQLTSLREIHCLVGSYLHQVFIAEPSMVKLVHFQGYPIQLLPMVASGVPSVHIAMDFISELLSQPQLEKQVFAIQLASNVTAIYPLPDSMVMARSIFKKLDQLVIEVPQKNQDSVFKPILPAIISFCKTFPPLCTEATTFLLNLCKTCQSAGRFEAISEQVITGKSTKKEVVISDDPVFGMEDALEYLNSISLTKGATWAFEQIVQKVILRVSGKAYM